MKLTKMFLFNNLNTYVKLNPGRILTHFCILRFSRNLIDFLIFSPIRGPRNRLRGYMRNRGNGRLRIFVASLRNHV